MKKTATKKTPDKGKNGTSRASLPQEKPPTTKTCSKCKTEKNLSDFPLTKIRGRVMHRSWCDACMKVYYKAYRLAKVKK